MVVKQVYYKLQQYIILVFNYYENINIRQMTNISCCATFLIPTKKIFFTDQLNRFLVFIMRIRNMITEQCNVLYY